MYSQDQTQKAADALLKHMKNDEKESNNLLGEESEPVYLNIAAKKYFTDRKQLKPKRIVLPHALRTKEDTSICLFTKDPQRTYKDALQGEGSPSAGMVDRVVGVSKLKGKFKPYQARRSLLSGHELFLAQDSVVTTLPKLLGKVFYDGSVSRIPLSIKTGGKDEVDAAVVKKEIDQLLTSTVFVLSPGAMVSIKVGTTDLSGKQIAENVQAVVDYFVANIQPWDMIRSMYLKAQKSESLPIFLTDKVQVEATEAEKQQAEKRKRDTNQLTDFEQELANEFDEEDVEQFTNKKIKKQD